MSIIRNGPRARPRGAMTAPVGPNATAVDPELVRALATLLSETDLAEMEIAKGDLRIKLVRHGAPAAPQAAFPIAPAPAGTTPAAQPVAPPPAPTPAADHPGAVKSPMVGTAYRRASPEGKPFVEVGSSVKAGEKILLVEAMKTFNEIVAPRAGTVTSVLVEDGQPVEYGQPLVVIE